MNESKIAVRYAKALFEAAQDQGKLDVIREDMDALLILEKQLPEFKSLLNSPVINLSQKQKILTSLFKGKTEDLTFRFLMLITENNREAFLPSVCRVFKDLYKRKKGIKAALVTTAAVLQGSTSQRIKLTLEEYYKSNIELETEMNTELIGGLVLRIEDQQLDASVSSQLKKVKQELTQSVIS